MSYSIEQMRTIKEDRTKELATLRTNFGKMDTYYNQTFELGAIKSGVSTYIPGTCREQINSALVQLMSLGQKVNILPWSKDEKINKLISKLSHFGEAFLSWLENNFDTNIRSACIKHLLMYGMCSTKTIYLSTSRLRPEGKKERKVWEDTLERTFPYAVQVVHPSNLLWEEGIEIEYFERTIGSIKREFPAYETEAADSFKVQWWEFWTPKEKQFFVGDEPILKDALDEATGLADTANPYLTSPYDYVFANLGLESPDAAPEHAILGILSHILSSYKAEARLKTALLHNIEQGIYTMPKVEKQPGTDFQLATNPFDLSIVPEDYKYGHLNPEQVIPDAYKWLSIIESDQEAAMPFSLQGRYPKGTTSGYQYASALSIGRMGLMPIKSTYEKMAERLFSKILWMTKYVVEEPVGIAGRIVKDRLVETISPSEYNPANIVPRVTLDAETPEQKADRIMLGMRMLALNPQRAPSLRTIFKDFLGLDPEDEDTERGIEAILSNPLIQQSQAMAALKQYGHEEVLQLIQSGQLNLGGGQHNYETNSPNVGTKGRSFQDANRGKMNTDQIRGEEMTDAENIEANS